MLLKAAQFLNDAQLPDEEAQNRNNPANETDKVPESPGRKRKMATIKRVPTKKRDCKGQASSSQSIQTKEAENIPPNESANQLADQGTVSADAVSPIESIDPLNNDQEDEMHFLQLGNFNLDYELASPIQPTMPPYFLQENEMADLPIPTQQLANKFRQNALLSEPDRTGGSGSSLSPKIQNLDTDSRKASTQKVYEALKKAHEKQKGKMPIDFRPSGGVQVDDGRPIHLQLDDFILEWLNVNGEDASQGGEAVQEEADFELIERYLHSRSDSPNANDEHGYRMIAVPMATNSGTSSSRNQAENKSAKSVDKETLQFFRQLKTRRPSPTRSPAANADSPSSRANWAPRSPGIPFESPLLNNSQANILKSSNSLTNVTQSPNSPSNLLLRDSSATAAQKMKGIGSGDVSSNAATNIQKQRPILINAATNIQRQRPILINAATNIQKQRPILINAATNIQRQRPILINAATNIQRQRPILINAATNIQRQRPIQIEEIVVQTVAESIRALGKSPKIRFGFVASNTLPFALDIDMNGILELIKERKKDASFKAESVIYPLRLRKNERVNEILFEIMEESSELRGQMFQDLLQVNMQNKWRELNFLFTFARLYRKLRTVLEWTNVGELNWQLKIHEDLLVCLNTLSKEILKEIVVTCIDIKSNMALKWLANLYQLEGAIQLTNFGIWLLFSRHSLRFVGMEWRPTTQKGLIDKIDNQLIEEQMDDNYSAQAVSAWTILKKMGDSSVFEKFKAIFNSLANKVKQCKVAMEHSKMPVKAMTMLGVMRQIRDELAKSDFDKITMPKLSEERANGLEIVKKSLALLNAKIELFIRQRKELWDVHEFCKKLMESRTNTLNP
uniref:Uncharacterized protein n=1 Tax=Globodera rostochiensis TaxID=31243 RepID=A0A914I240_GLORO